MATTENKQRMLDYPKEFNTRENRLIRHGHSVLVSSAESFSLSDEDSISAIRKTGASTVTLPPAATSKGRIYSFIQTDAAILTIAQNADSANIDGANADFTALDAADDWCELFCTGSEWIILKQHIA
jgi:hypothetical protein